MSRFIIPLVLCAILVIAVQGAPANNLISRLLNELRGEGRSNEERKIERLNEQREERMKVQHETERRFLSDLESFLQSKVNGESIVDRSYHCPVKSCQRNFECCASTKCGTLDDNGKFTYCSSGNDNCECVFASNTK